MNDVAFNLKSPRQIFDSLKFVEGRGFEFRAAPPAERSRNVLGPEKNGVPGFVIVR